MKCQIIPIRVGRNNRKLLRRPGHRFRIPCAQKPGKSPCRPPIPIRVSQHYFNIQVFLPVLVISSAHRSDVNAGRIRVGASDQENCIDFVSVVEIPVGGRVGPRLKIKISRIVNPALRSHIQENHALRKVVVITEEVVVKMV